jgi:hypothetical protein
MRLASSIITALALLVMFSMWSMTMTGCGNNPLSPKDTAATEDLLPPSNGAVTALSATLARISFHGSNNESSFRGYALLNAAGDTILDSIRMSTVFTGDTAFPSKTIDIDVDKSWKIASFNKSGALSATKLTVTFHARTLATVVMSKNEASATGDGLNIDGSAALVNADDAIKTNGYTDASGADFILEKPSSNSDSAFMTPVNGAFIIGPTAANTILSQAEITADIALANKTAIPAAGAGAYLYTSGSSVRVNGTGTLLRPSSNTCLILVSASGKIARLVFGTVTTMDMQATISVYEPSTTPGVLLYKRR